ncbi:MAG: hypothetical protein R3219_04730, partial [Hydrogenovibrio sp.]|nr:hypothetical protein [Hydrogenovibrio sp.]
RKFFSNQTQNLPAFSSQLAAFSSACSEEMRILTIPEIFATLFCAFFEVFCSAKSKTFVSL